MNLTSNLIEVEDSWEAANDWFLKDKLAKHIWNLRCFRITESEKR